MKKKLIKGKVKIISAVIPDEIFQQLEKYALKKERSKSWIIKKAINNFLKENENR
jgi:predicted transcriptional regulator